MGGIGNVEPIGADTSCGMRTAFEQMPSNGRSSHAIPSVPGPPKMVLACTSNHRGIRNATGDHDIGTRVEGRNNPLASYVRIRRYQPILHGRERLLRIEIIKTRIFASLPEDRNDIVAGNDRDLHLATSTLLQCSFARTRTSERIQSSRIGDQFAGATRRPIGCQPAYDLDEVLRVTLLRIPLPLEREDRHRYLGEVIHGQIIKSGFLD